MVLDPGSAGWSFQQPTITTRRLVGRLPATQGPCPECGRPAVWTTLDGGSVVQHHDPIEHDACPLTVERNRARRVLVEAAEKLDHLELLNHSDHSSIMGRTLRDLAAEQRTLIDVEVANLPAGYRLCMHDGLETLCEPPATFEATDAYTFRVRQRGHVLEPGEPCRHHGTRTEYGWPAGAIVEQPRPCGRLDDCRVIEAADGTRYWFRSHGCPVEALPAPPWSDLDEWAADSWRQARRWRAPWCDPEAYADAFDAHVRDIVTMIAEPVVRADDESLYDKIVRLFNMIENGPEERFQPYMWPRRWLSYWPTTPLFEANPGRYLGGLDKP